MLSLGPNDQVIPVNGYKIVLKPANTTIKPYCMMTVHLQIPKQKYCKQLL